MNNQICKQRVFAGGTPFGLWTRGSLPGQITDVSCLSSQAGYVRTDIDTLWHNFRTGEWLLIEEKIHGGRPSYCQYELLDMLNSSIVHPLYRGAYLVRFENTNPDDGKIIIAKSPDYQSREITAVQFRDFLRDFSVIEA